MYKMYFLVLFSLSNIQKGIQSGHAAVEYMLAYWHKKDCDNRATNDKTFIILNGGTTKTMENHKEYLNKLNMEYVTFEEPDLWGVTTAIAFLAKDDDYITRYFTNNFKLA